MFTFHNVQLCKVTPFFLFLKIVLFFPVVNQKKKQKEKNDVWIELEDSRLLLMRIEFLSTFWSLLKFATGEISLEELFYGCC